MAVGDLTTLAHVYGWLGDTKSNPVTDAKLARLITAASKWALNYVGRSSFGATVLTDTYDGYGKNWMLLRQWPVISISSIEFSGQKITAPSTGNPPSNGYVVENPDSAGGAQQRLSLVGSCFPNCRGGVIVTYTAGYQINDEAGQVPETGEYTIQPVMTWLADAGVIYANGSGPLTPANGPTPGAGEYTVSATGLYTFNAADAGAGVLISYSYVPADLEQGVIELVGERYKASAHIGINSQSVQSGVGEVVSYSQKQLNDFAMDCLRPYKRVAPT